MSEAPERWFLYRRDRVGSWARSPSHEWRMGIFVYAGWVHGWKRRSAAEACAKKLTRGWTVVSTSELAALDDMEHARIALEAL